MRKDNIQKQGLQLKADRKESSRYVSTKIYTSRCSCEVRGATGVAYVYFETLCETRTRRAFTWRPGKKWHLDKFQQIGGRNEQLKELTNDFVRVPAVSDGVTFPDSYVENKLLSYMGRRDTGLTMGVVHASWGQSSSANLQ